MGATVVFARYVYFLPVVIFHVHASGSSHYTTHSLDSDRTCSMSVLQQRTLKVHSKSGVIVEENRYFDQRSLSGKFPYKCSFIVDADSSLGIIAVVQEMKFRKNEVTGECIDYVQFRHSTNYLTVPVIDLTLQHKEDRPWGPKICGKVNAKEPDITSINIVDPSKEKLLPYAYVDHGGKIDVRIYLANQTRSPDTELSLKIAFTAYQPCSEASPLLYRKCSPSVCIWEEFFNDEYLNCPFTSCMDVGGCQVYYEAGFRPSTGLATKIMVGAVAGVFTMFIVFIMFLWVFRHCAMCWNSPTPSVQSTTQMRPVPTVEEVQPTAPPGSPSMDKDLPPSYESLFPNA